MTVEAPASKPFPVVFEADYPEGQSRWKALLRVFLAIPVLIFAGILVGGSLGAAGPDEPGPQVVFGAATSIVLAIWITIVLRQSIPRWLFDFWVAVQRFFARAIAYLLLLTDEYPPFEGPHPVRYEVTYPERLSRWRVFVWKFITVIPHAIVLLALTLTFIVVQPIAWIAILITGTYPREMHRYVTGVLRWWARVYAYAISLTDEYPPYSMAADAGSASRRSYVVSAVIGLIATAMLVAGVVALTLFARGEKVIAVSYDGLLSGAVTQGETNFSGVRLRIALSGATDPADAEVPSLQIEDGKRLVGFRMTFETQEDRTIVIRASQFELEDSSGDEHDPLLVLVNGRPAPEKIGEDELATAELIFELDEEADPRELRYERKDPFQKDIVYRLE